MKKAAIFVEGQTEVIFTLKLLKEIAGEKHIHFEQQSYIGKRFVQLTGAARTGNEKFFFLIIDCHSDGAVKSAIIERREELVCKGYQLILGLRDLYPLPKTDLSKLERGLSYQLPTANCPTHICVAVMEVEAWFAQEENHYLVINGHPTKGVIKSKLIFDLDNDCAEDIPKPSEFLNSVYQIVGKKYTKKFKSVSLTVDALDYSNLYFNLRHKLPSFRKFLIMQPAVWKF